MESKIIADASALVSLAYLDDVNHKQALSIADEMKRSAASLIIPTEVFAETINILGKKFNHTLANRFAEELFSSSEYDTLDTNQEIRIHALEKFKRQAESVSFTDCLVMAVADSYETKEIFGFDDCFKKNGYSLPKPQ